MGSHGCVVIVGLARRGSRVAGFGSGMVQGPHSHSTTKSCRILQGLNYRTNKSGFGGGGS